MKIAIVTQPLMSNYGGLLQNWALQQVLKREFPDAEVITFDQTEWTMPLYIKSGIIVKRIFGLSKKPKPTSFDIFRLNNIDSTKKAETLHDFVKLDRQLKPDVYIVGSDQVWRPRMVNHIDANFLSFTKCKNKLAYAASFGVDFWEFSDHETQICRDLAADFKSISVREDSGCELCKKYLGVNAVQVLDPTLLLSSSDYDCLLSKDQLSNQGSHVFTYILDTSPKKRAIVSQILEENHELAAAHDVNGNNISLRITVEEWIAGIRNSKMVICDSFHGVAFSIIYNKDFVVLANEARGNTRIESILNLFGLKGRLINSDADILKLGPIDWHRVNSTRVSLSSKSLSFLHAAI